MSEEEKRLKMKEWLVQRILFTMHQGGLTTVDCVDAVREAEELMKAGTANAGS